MSEGSANEGGSQPESSMPHWARCSVCYEVPVNEEVRCMPCLHLVCSTACANKIKLSESTSNVGCIGCKTCAKKHLETELTTSAYLLERQERERLAANFNSIENPTCTYCIRGAKAMSWCETCGEHMCSSCNDHHGIATRTRNHETTKVEEKPSKKPDFTNTSHTVCILHDKRLTQFCTSCVSTLCDVCAEKRHNGHAIESLKDMADETRSTIKRSLKQFESILPKYHEMQKILTCKSKQMFETQRNFLITEASAQLTRLLSALMKREMEQRKELTETVILKAKEINLKMLKIRSLLSQTQHFLDFAGDLLKDGSDWAVITNRQLVESQLFNLVGNAEQFSHEGSIEAYTEKGFNFVMDKSVGHQAERHINMTAKITYSFNPKAPSETKWSHKSLRNDDISLGNKSLAVPPTLDPIYGEGPPSVLYAAILTNKDHSLINRTIKSSASFTEAVPSGSKTNQNKTPRMPMASERSIAVKAPAVVQQPYSNLTDQLIIEPVDSGSEIDDELKMDADYDNGEDTDVVQESGDNQDGPSKQQRHKRGRGRGRGRGRRSRSRCKTPTESTVKIERVQNTHYESKVNQNNLKVTLQRSKTPEKASISEMQAAINSDSDSEGHNGAPNLSPETMKTPPRLRRVGESRESASQAGEVENLIDARPPVLVPSVHIPSQATPEMKTDNTEDPEATIEPRRGRRKSGRQTPIPRLQDTEKPAGSMTTRRRGSMVAEMTVDEPQVPTERRRGRSRSRGRVATPEPVPVVELPSKRERKKKTHPEFVEDNMTTRKRARSGKGSPANSGTPGTPPTPVASTSAASDNKRGRTSRGRGGRGQSRNRSRSRGRQSAAVADLEDDLSCHNEIDGFDVSAEVLDFPLVREDKMRIGNSEEQGENEDYCNVCLDGGDGDLLCCDNCPKVYHLKCHMPAVDEVPHGDWQCLFCKAREEIVNVVYPADKSYPPESLQYKDYREFMITCKFMSDIYTVKESLVTRAYFETLYRLKKQERPSSLNYIRNRLIHLRPSPYTCFAEVVDDLRLMFTQAYELYDESSKEFAIVNTFENKFSSLYEEYLPLLQSESAESSEAVDELEASA